MTFYNIILAQKHNKYRTHTYILNIPTISVISCCINDFYFQLKNSLLPRTENRLRRLCCLQCRYNNYVSYHNFKYIISSLSNKQHILTQHITYNITARFMKLDVVPDDNIGSDLKSFPTLIFIKMYS